MILDAGEEFGFSVELSNVQLLIIFSLILNSKPQERPSTKFMRNCILTTTYIHESRTS